MLEPAWWAVDTYYYVPSVGMKLDIWVIAAFIAICTDNILIICPASLKFC